METKHNSDKTSFTGKGIYETPRIRELLAREVINISVSYVGRLMRAIEYVVTTDAKHTYKVSNNELNREFESDAIGKKWVSDISYVKVGKNWNYLTVILDLADRKVVG